MTASFEGRELVAAGRNGGTGRESASASRAVAAPSSLAGIKPGSMTCSRTGED